MKYLQKAFNKHLISKILKIGYKPALKPKNEESRMQDLKKLKLLEDNIDSVSYTHLTLPTILLV